MFPLDRLFTQIAPLIVIEGEYREDERSGVSYDLHMREDNLKMIEYNLLSIHSLMYLSRLMNNYCGFNIHTKCIGNNRTPISTILPDYWNDGSIFPEEDDSLVALDELQYDVTLDGYYEIFDSFGRMPIINFSLRPPEGEEEALKQERNIIREQQEKLERAAIEFDNIPCKNNRLYYDSIMTSYDMKS
ncbi:uncharacterized protein LOC122850460 [Aphidius gifuensis]|uniref:uncharacterized protein LOC122850460 n=1 Tax=Aphidius gifuensis TaxID=684658 RepID=UPI001CDC14FB|nr:uncharacterized protein LOC122850460 [Aphidius gifuensis]